MDCLFCKIDSGDVPSKEVYKDDHVHAFLDINPLTPGHTVVIPREHYANILDLPDNLVDGVFTGVKNATKLLKDTLGIEGFTIGINHGTIGHQEIDHLHIHVIPRYKDDGGGGLHSIVNYSPSEDLDVVYKKILDKNK